MKNYTTYPPNYDKFPTIKADARYTGDCFAGWDNIIGELRRAAEAKQGRQVIAVECYQGTDDEEILGALAGLNPTGIFRSGNAMLPAEEICGRTYEYVTDDEIFGYMSPQEIDVWFAPEAVARMRRQIAGCTSGLAIVYGVGAAYIWPEADLLVYADMARWEIQLRFRTDKAANVGLDNATERATLQYKRAFFADWRICDRFKRKLMARWDYLLDTNTAGQPKLVTGASVRATLRDAVARPFRVVPFFDPGPWGGQWMKEVCDLDRPAKNYAWCFDCVPEENSLLLEYGHTKVEIPSIDLVFAQPEGLLGQSVYERFGAEFPIRFDFLDTMDGGNLSLQVHPPEAYIKDKFGMAYTQEESYYMLDTQEGATVYLGVKNGTDPARMLAALEKGQQTGAFDAERFVGKYPVRKHQHVLIPPGTIHCSGRNSMVLEISATPYIFTFKLWDWGRPGLDGRPRPINIGHGSHVIRWDRDETWVRENILDRAEPVATGPGWREERTGLHEKEFIETRRHWFSVPVEHDTAGNLNVLNLVEGREAIVESPGNRFEPFVVHYAETFIVPAAVGRYTIRPYGESAGKECATLKAYVRTR